MLFLMFFISSLNAKTIFMEPTFDARSINRLIQNAEADDEIIFEKGEYNLTQNIIIENKSRLTLDTNGSVILNRNLTPKPPELLYHECQNQCSADSVLNWKPAYPVLYSEGTIDIRNSKGITIKNLAFSNFSPNGIRILGQSDDIKIQRNQFKGGTNAIYAKGPYVTRVTIENNIYAQEKKTWSQLDWQHVHHGKYNFFNGAFFQGKNLLGPITIKDNIIQDTFNGIRIKSKDMRVKNKNIHIVGNSFLRISDNAIEAENRAFHWRIENNVMDSVYAPFSFDGVHGRDITIFNNIVVFNELPRRLVDPEEISDHRHQNSRIFKLKSRKLFPMSQLKDVKIIENHFDTFYRSSGDTAPLTDISTWPPFWQITNNKFKGPIALNAQGDLIPKNLIEKNAFL